jgi:hypothetical protein
MGRNKFCGGYSGIVFGELMLKLLGDDASVDAGVDASADAGVDASADAGVYVSVDVSRVASVDAGVDVSSDFGDDISWTISGCNRMIYLRGWATHCLA